MIIQTTKQYTEVKSTIGMDGKQEVNEPLALPLAVGQNLTAKETGDFASVANAAPHVAELAVELRYDPTDPKELQQAADIFCGISDNLAKQAKLRGEKAPSVNIAKTTTGLAIGAVGGYSASLILQELGKAGSASGNPYLSTFSAACALAGAAVGAGAGAGLLKMELNLFGAKITTI